jgi:hypothetical protein
MSLAEPLSADEKALLYDHRKSELCRIFIKSINYLQGVEAAKMSHASIDQLPVIQGRFQGLNIAKNLLALGNFEPPPSDKK